MAKQVRYRCDHCGSWARVRYTEDMAGSTKAVCHCKNNDYQAEYAKLITHLEDLRPPIPQRKSMNGQLAFY